MPYLLLVVVRTNHEDVTSRKENGSGSAPNVVKPHLGGWSSAHLSVTMDSLANFSKRSCHDVAIAAVSACLWMVQITNGQVLQSNPPQGYARIVVFREGHFSGMKAHPLLFVGDKFIAEGDNGTYSSIDVAPGQITVTATAMTYWEHLNPDFHPPAGHWSTLLGCNAINWDRWATGSQADAEVCLSKMTELIKRCGVYRSISGCVHPGCIETITTHIPSCNPLLQGIGYPFKYLDLSARRRELTLDAEAGKTYFVQWVFSPDAGFCGKTGCGGKLQLISDTEGRKKTKKLKAIETH